MPVPNNVANVKNKDGGIQSTRGALTPAKIIELEDAKIDTKTNKIDLKNVREGKISITCMFNPYEYTLSKSNQFEEKESAAGSNSPRANFKKAGAQTLQLNLVFDAYEKENKDIHEITNQLWQLMAVRKVASAKPQDRDSPPLVAFSWAGFYFVAYITQMSQKFTLFTQAGFPVRAEVTITFTQYVDVDDYPNQNPTSGDGPVDRVWTVIAGDRLDTIAAQIYGSADKWRLIAQFNQLDNPTAIYPGQQIVIPFAS